MRAPSISVIISTYHWSGALYCAIASVLQQTLADIEIIVVGDACTDDSDSIVAGFADPRLRWINLETRAGHQFGPNNAGLAEARGEWIAYLGHDDLWHRAHLETALRAAKAKSADMVAGVTLFFGPPSSNICGLGGLFLKEELQPPEWAPPSSWVHRRSLVNKVGLWRDPMTLRIPADVDFMKRALACGARVVSSDELTVFKFNAGRRNTYKLKNNDEQRDMLEKMRAGVDVRHAALIDFLKSEKLGLAFHATMPPDESGQGEDFLRHRVLKGLLPRFAEHELLTIDGCMRFPVSGFGEMEWHDEETHPEFGAFRWSGPQAETRVDLPVRFDRDMRVRIHVLTVVSPDVLPLTLKIGDRPVAARVETTSAGTMLIEAHASPGGPEASLSVAIALQKTLRPSDIAPSADRRWLGAAVNWIEIAPV